MGTEGKRWTDVGVSSLTTTLVDGKKEERKVGPYMRAAKSAPLAVLSENGSALDLTSVAKGKARVQKKVLWSDMSGDRVGDSGEPFARWAIIA